MIAKDAEQILILTASETESETCRRLLSRAGCDTQILQNESSLIERARGSIGAILVSSEVLTDQGVSNLNLALRGQPNWSNIPVVVILKSDDELASLKPLGPIVTLKEPVHVGTLVTTVQAALNHRRRQYQVRDLLVQLAYSNRAKSDFLANVSHEIRTPLGAVLGFSELLMDQDASDNERQVYSTAIRRNGQTLSALIDDILDLAKVESGRIEIESVDFSLNELIADTVSSFEVAAGKKGLQLHVHAIGQNHDVLRGDPVRLRQVLNNVLGNAIKFTSHGSVTMRVSLDENSNSLAELNVEIEDTGIGISARQIETLFQPFSQADPSSTRRYGGTGLGLFLSRRLLQMMSGDLSLKWSIPGGGSCFTIKARVELGSALEKKAEPAPAWPNHALPLAGAQILLVDDSLDNQVLISQILKLLGANVELASDGVECIERAMAHKYDVILMDLQMPRMGGVEATRMLREKGYQRPIVALTAHALKEDRQRCLNVGCTDYLTKPIQKSHLVQVLSRVARPQSELQHH